jgi:hypothetical protein
MYIGRIVFIKFFLDVESIQPLLDNKRDDLQSLFDDGWYYFYCDDRGVLFSINNMDCSAVYNQLIQT